MDEEILTINKNTRNEKIKNFFFENKKNLIIIFSITLSICIGYFIFDEIDKRNKIKLANQYNSVVINFTEGNTVKTVEELTKIINKKDTTYSPLALYFLIENNLIKEKKINNSLFDILIDKTKLEYEIKNLIIYKKALYNSNSSTENELIRILNPIVNSESIWKSHALYLMAEYFYSNNEKQKSKEFFNKILILPNSNKDIRLESQKRLNRDLSE